MGWLHRRPCGPRYNGVFFFFFFFKDKNVMFDLILSKDHASLWVVHSLEERGKKTS